MKPSVPQLLGAISAILGSALANSSSASTLYLTNVSPGDAIKSGTKLRILCAGDSITTGSLSDKNGGDGNGYRRQLQKDLSSERHPRKGFQYYVDSFLVDDEVVFAGTVTNGNMTDGYFAAWRGKTIKYISDHIGPSLDQRPNIILLHAGTNDMDDRPELSTEGDNPTEAAKRLGNLIDQMIETCPDAVILVAVILDTCDSHKAPRIPKYQSLIPGVVQKRRESGHHVLAVDFSMFPRHSLQDCIHPSNEGYRTLGDYWYNYMAQIPTSWIKDPIGDDPNRSDAKESAGTMLRVPWLILFQSGSIALYRLLC